MKQWTFSNASCSLMSTDESAEKYQPNGWYEQQFAFSKWANKNKKEIKTLALTLTTNMIL